MKVFSKRLTVDEVIAKSSTPRVLKQCIYVSEMKTIKQIQLTILSHLNDRLPVPVKSAFNSSQTQLLIKPKFI